EWSAGRAPPVALGIDRADMATGIDGQPGQGKARGAHDAYIVLVDHHARARTTAGDEKAQADRVADSIHEVVVHDAQLAVVVEDANRGASDECVVPDRVVVDGRHVGVKENEGTAVHVEQVRGDL